MGTVYEAAHLLTDGRVALKVMNEGLRNTETAIARFVQEARAVARVAHPGVTRIYDAGSDGDPLWMAMELLTGESLGEVLARGPLRLDDVDELFTQLLDVLDHVHRAGIVHRDLKPENVFLAQLPGVGTRVKLLDFGIAKLSDGTLGAAATQVGLAMGTLHYMAPEQARHAKTVDHRADVYALGVILYECLSGTVPYEASTVGELVAKFYTEPPRPIELAPDDAARPYAALALACLSIDPEARPADCRVVAERLREASAARSATQRAVALAPSLSPRTERSALGPVVRPLASTAALLVGLWTAWAVTRGAPLSLAPGEERVHERPGAAPLASSAPSAPGPREIPPKPQQGAPRELTQESSEAGEPEESEPTRDAPGGRARSAATAHLRRAQLHEALAHKRPELQSCYERARADEDEGKRPVKLKVGLVIGSSGRVRRAMAAGGGSSSLHDCIEERVAHWRFPAAGQSSQQSFALAFEPSSARRAAASRVDASRFKADPY